MIMLDFEYVLLYLGHPGEQHAAGDEDVVDAQEVEQASHHNLTGERVSGEGGRHVTAPHGTARLLLSNTRGRDTNMGVGMDNINATAVYVTAMPAAVRQKGVKRQEKGVGCWRRSNALPQG